jgi:dipeptidyl-peptidase-4
MKPILLAITAAALCASAIPAIAQQQPQPQQRLTIERIFASPSLTGPAPRALKLSPDGKLVTLLRNRPDDRQRYDLWAIDTATGASRMLVDSKKLGSGAALSEAEKMQRERARIGSLTGIVSYSWAPNGRQILVPLEGDLYLADLDGGVQRLTNTPDSELDATVSESGRYVSYVKDQNLHVITLAGGGDRAVTSGGGGVISWGVAEFIAQEEMGRSRGHWWAPNDRRIAVARVDESKVEVATRASIGAEKTTTFEQRYPRAGTPNAAVDLYLMNPDGSGQVKADLGDNPDVYLARVNWLPDGSAVLVQRESRDQKRLDLLRVDAATGKSTLLFTERSPTWINLNNDLRVLSDGSLIWTSERSGFQHLYRWNKGKFTQLTSGDWATDGLVGIDEQAGKLFFAGFMDDTTERHLYSLDYRRKGAKPVRLTVPGTSNSAAMDAAGRHALITSSSPAQPSQVYLANAAGQRLAWIEQNAVTGEHPWAPFAAAAAQPRYGKLKAADGKTDLDYSILLPPGLKPGQRAPVFFNVYGGPSTRDVEKGFVSPMDQYLAQQGWIVFEIANRGEEGRGTAFQRPAYRALGGVEVEDQLAGLKWLKAQSFVDPERVGMFGWSYGGYMVLKLLEAAPHAFAAGVSGAPVTRWELYDTHYTERYMGNPATDPEPYRKASALEGAEKIADPLLLIHGMADDNVLFQNSTELMARLQAANRPFELMTYPGETHSAVGGRVAPHVWSTIERFMNREVKNKPAGAAR